MFWNDNARDATGRSAAGVIGRPLAALFPEPEGGPDRARFDLAAVIAGRDFTGAFRTKRADGSPVTLHVYATAGRKGDKVEGAVFLGRDLTNALELELSARFRDELFQTAGELTCDAIMVLDQQGRILEANGALAAMTGRSGDRLLETPLAELAAPGSRRALLAALERLWQERDAEFKVELSGRQDLQVRAAVLNLYGRRLALAVGRTLEPGPEPVPGAGLSYQQVFDAVQDAVILHRVDGTIIDANEGAARMLARPREEFPGLDINKLLPPTAQAWLVRLRDILLRDRRFYGEATGRRQDGTELPIELLSSLVKLEGEELVITVARDITERRRAERAVRESERLHRTTLNAMSDPAHVIDRDGNFLLVNDALLRMARELGVSEDPVGRNLYELFPFLEAQVRPATERVFETGRPVHLEEAFVIGGELREAEVDELPIFEDGRVVRVLTVIQDITERKRAERAMRESELLHRLSLNAMSDPAHVIDRDGRIVLMNDAFQRWNRSLGIEGEPVGRDLFELFPFLGPAVREEYERVFETGRPVRTEETNFLLGRRVKTETTKLPIIEEGRVNRVLTVVRDTTERERRAETLDRLAGTAMGFVELPLEADIYHYASERLAELLPAGAVFAVSEYDEPGKRLLVRRVVGLTEEQMAAVTDLLGAPPDTLVLDRFETAVREMLIAGTLTEIPGGLHGALLGRVPEPVCRRIETLLGTERAVSVGLRRQDRLYGNITIYLRAGEGLDRGLVETFAGQCSIALERREAERALAASEERFSSLFFRAPIGIYRTTPDGRVLMANPALVRMLGYRTFSELAAENLEEVAFRPGYDRSEFKRRVEDEGELVGLEAVWTRADGSGVYVRENARAVRGPDGRLEYYEGTVEDLTERRRTEEEIHRQSKLRELLMGIAATYINLPFDRADAAIEASLAEIGGFVGADRAYVFEYDFERQVGINTHEWCAEGIEPQKRRLQAVPLGRVPEAVEPHRRGQVMYFPDVRALPPESFLRREFEAERIRSVFTVPLMAGERCLGFAGFDSVRARREYTEAEQELLEMFAQMLADMRRRHETEEALRDSREQYSALFSNAPIGIYRTAPDGRMLMANPALVRMLGFRSFEEMTLEKLQELDARSGYDRAEFVRRMETEGEILGLESTVVMADGARRHIRENARSVSGPDGAVAYYEGTAEDLTERHRAEEELRESEARFRLLAESTPAMIYLCRNDRRWTMFYLNDEVKLVTGYPKEVFLKDELSFAELIVPEDSDSVYSGVSRALAEGSSFQLAYRIRRADGTIRWVEEFGDGVRRDGEVQYLVGIITDITDRRQAEDTLRASEERYRLLAESAPDYVFVIDREGRLEYVNARGARALGAEAGQLVGRRIAELFPSDIAERHARNVGRVFESGEELRFEGPSSLADREAWLDTVLQPVRDTAGEVRAVLGVTRDLTERERARQALEESEKRYRNVVERALDGICIIRDGRIVYLNKQLAGLAGRTVEEVLGRPFVEFLAPDEREKVTDRYRRRMAGEDVPQNYETAILHSSGRRVEVELKAGVIEHEGSPADLAFVRDITERKRVEAERRAGERIFRAILDGSPDGIAIHREGRVVLMNPAGARILGYDDPAEVIGAAVFDFLHPDERDEVLERMRRILQTGPTGAPAEARMRCRDGSYVPLEVANALVEWQGNPAIQVVFRDITRRRAAEQSRAESEERYRALFETAPYPVMLVREGRCLLANPATARLLGYTDPAELTGVSVLELVAPEERGMMAERMTRLAAGQENPAVKVFLLARDGSRPRIVSTSRPVTVNGESAALIIGYRLPESGTC